MRIDIKTNFDDVMRQLDQLHRDISEPAAARAVNRVLDKGKTRMARAIAARYNIKQSVVREGLRVKAASRKGGVFRIEGFLESPTKRGRSRNLIHFGAKQTKQGVTVKILRGGPRKLIPSAFIINKDNAYGGVVMIRSGKSRLPIESRQTIDVQQMFNARKVKDDIVAFMKAEFAAEFAHQVKFYTERFNARRAA